MDQTAATEILDKLPAAIQALDRDGRCTYVNEAGARLARRPRDEMLGRSAHDLLGSAGDAFDAVRHRVMNDGTTVAFEQHVDSQGRWYEVTVSQVTSGVVVLVDDVTLRKEAQARSEASDERLRLYFELGLIGMAITSPSMGILEVNDELCTMLGYERGELTRLTWAQLTHPDDLAADIRQFERVVAGEIDGYALEKRWVRKDGRIIDAEISVKCVRNAGGQLEYFVAFLEDVTERKQAAAELLRAHSVLEHRVIERTRELGVANEHVARLGASRGQLLHRLITAQEEERRRISRELHDQLGQHLSALVMKIGALRRSAEGDAVVREPIASLEALARQLDVDLDFIARSLRPTALDDLGLQTALANFGESWTKHSGIPVNLHVRGMERDRLAPDVETVLYRILQESLTNVARHAEASNVDVLLERRPEHVSLIVEDNGKGFAGPDEEREGLGIVGMRERAALVGGTLAVESRCNAGTTVVVRVPTPRRSS